VYNAPLLSASPKVGCRSQQKNFLATVSVGGSEQPPAPDTFNFQDLVDEIKYFRSKLIPVDRTPETCEARRYANRDNAQHSTAVRRRQSQIFHERRQRYPTQVTFSRDSDSVDGATQVSRLAT